MAVAEVARQVRAACAQVDDVADFARRVSEPEWRGSTADAYRSRVSEIGMHADAQSMTIRQVVAALDRYAAALATVDHRLAGEELCQDLRRLMPEGAAGWRSALDSPDPAEGALSRRPREGNTAEVQRWWSRLSDAERQGVLIAAPSLIGRLDGLPGTVRSIANRVTLTRDLTAGGWRQVHGVLTDDERAALRNAQAAAAALTELEQRDLPTQLYLYDPEAFGGDGRVAIAAGEVDDADHVGVLVPGLGNDAADIRAVAERSANLVEAAARVDGEETTAVLAWIGYDAPDNLLPWGNDRDAFTVATVDAAETGGHRLADMVDGLRAADTDGRMHLTVIGHSYGSTSVGQAAHDHRPDVDDLVVVGSPGLGPEVDQVTDLGLPRGQVWVGANSRDPVAQLGDVGWLSPGRLGLGLGANPASEEFDAQRFAAETVGSSGSPRAGDLGPLEAHTTYFEHNTESLWNLSHIVTGHGDQVLIAQPVTDSWRSDPVDPESERVPTTPSTR